jgi:hypothetical protein
MGGWRKYFFLLAGLSTVMGIALLFGAAERGAADTTDPPACAGKPLCVTITDQDKATRSVSGTDRFMTDTVKIYNGGTNSNLVNITLSASWSDDGVPAASTTSAFQSSYSSSACTQPDPAVRTITCTTPKSLGPNESATYTLVFRTATLIPGPPALPTGTSLTAAATAKEQQPPKKNGTDNTAVVTTLPNSTPYEGDANLDVSAAGGTIPTVTLATTQKGSPGYSEVASLKVPPNSTAVTATQGLYSLGQDDRATGFCPSGYDCFGQQVTVVTAGLSPVNLQLTYNGPSISGLTENNLVVVHYRTATPNTATIISKACSGAVFSGQPPSSDYTPNGCRRVHIDHLQNGNEMIQVDAWDTSNGGWGTAH